MKITFILFFISLALYPLSLLAAIFGFRFPKPFQKVFLYTNLLSLAATLILLFLWAFDVHLSALNWEHLPFWLFLISANLLYGLTNLTRRQKEIFGIFFYGHLVLSLFMVIPFMGIRLSSTVYAPFLEDRIIFENTDLVLAEESRGFLAQKPPPKVWIKHGIFALKYTPNLPPTYSVDSARLTTSPSLLLTLYQRGTIQRVSLSSEE